MSKFKNLFIAVLVTLCLTSGLAAPVSALDVSTEISHFYFSINGSTFKSSGNYISGAMISGNPTDTGNTTVTSYAILVPFTAPSFPGTSRIFGSSRSYRIPAATGIRCSRRNLRPLCPGSIIFSTSASSSWIMPRTLW